MARITDNRIVNGNDFMNQATDKWNEAVQQNGVLQEAMAEIIRQQVYSGVLEAERYKGGWSVPERGGYQTFDAPGSVSDATLYYNNFRMGAFGAIINGHKLEIESYPYSSEINSITLPEPPKSGNRDDLVFLEMFWTLKSPGDPIYEKGCVDAEVVRYADSYEKVAEWRFRVVAGVDFDKFSSSGFTTRWQPARWEDVNLSITAQGGNDLPLGQDEGQLQHRHFMNANPAISGDGTFVYKWYTEDRGLYIAGRGDDSSKDILKTADGRVYAIPLFRVKRRNNAGYRDDNLNGAIEFFEIHPKESTKITANVDFTVDTYNGSKLKTGDVIVRNNTKIDVVKADGTDIVTFRYAHSSSGWGSQNPYYPSTSDRPDGKFANIIHQDDIIDLRHQVSLEGYDYNHLLSREFNRYMRAEGINEEMHKQRFNLMKAPANVEPSLMPVRFKYEDGTERELVNLLADGTPSNGFERFTKTGLGEYVLDTNYGGYSLEVKPNQKLLFVLDKESEIKNYIRFDLDGAQYENVRGSETYTDHLYTAFTVPDVEGLVLRVFFINEGSKVIKPRLYEVDEETLSLIDQDEDYTGYEKINEKYPFVTSYPNIVENLIDYKYLLDTEPLIYKSNYLGRDCVSFIPGSTAPSLRIFEGKFKENTQYTLSFNVFIKSNETYAGAGIRFHYTDGTDSGVTIVTTGKDDFVFKKATSEPNKTIAFISGDNNSHSREVYLEANSIILREGEIGLPIYVPKGRWFTPHDYAEQLVHNKQYQISEQRKQVSHKQISEKVVDIIEPLNTPQPHVEVVQSTEGKWQVGDSIKVTSGEGIITGVIDADTGITTVVSYGDGTNSNTNASDRTKILVEDSTRLAVGDVVQFVNRGGHYALENGTWDVNTITAINGRELTFQTEIASGNVSGYDLYEVTTSSSSPIISSLNAEGELTTWSDIGTWSNLGTKEATFTIVTDPTTVSKSATAPVKIEYSVNYSSGEGLDYLPSKVLGAKVNGQNLIKGNTVTIKNNLAGKVYGNTDLVPHSYDWYRGEELGQPSEFLWLGQDKVNKLARLDGNVDANTTSTGGQTAQSLFRYNIIRAVEDKLGESFFSGCITKADKVQRLKDTVTEVKHHWNGYGTHPTGNMAKVDYWNDIVSDWFVKRDNNKYAEWGQNHDKGVVQRITTTLGMSGTKRFSYAVDSDGYLYFVAFSDKSDGITDSIIYTDYAELEISLSVAEQGYDVFVPQEQFPVLSENLLMENQAYPIDTSGFGIFADSVIELEEKGVIRVQNPPGGLYGLGAGVRIDDTEVAYDYVTLSGEIKVVKGTKFRLSIYLDNHTPQPLIDATGEWQKLYFSGHVTELKSIFVQGVSSEESEFLIRNLKLEKGINPNPVWSPGRKKQTIQNFLGKTKGDTVNVPHKVYHLHGDPSGIKPSDFIDEVGQEFYNVVGKPDGVVHVPKGTLTDGAHDMYMFEYDLSHLGLSTSELRLALRQLSAYLVAGGKGSSEGVQAHGITSRIWHAKTNKLYTLGNHEQSGPSLMTMSTAHPADYIDDNQKFYIIAHATHPSNTAIASEIIVDYTKLFIKLADYVDFVKANVVKVRAETKEIRLEYATKSYRTSVLDSVELFYNHKPVNPIDYATTVTVLADAGGFIVSDLSSAVADKQGAHHYLNPLYRVGNDRLDVYGKQGFGFIPFTADSKGVNIGSSVGVKADGLYECGTYKNIDILHQPLVGISQMLVMHDGILKLLIYSRFSATGHFDIGISTGNVSVILVPIQGNPLVKMKHGVRRGYLNSKDWHAPLEELLGIIDDNGNVIATYQ